MLNSLRGLLTVCRETLAFTGSKIFGQIIWHHVSRSHFVKFSLVQGPFSDNIFLFLKKFKKDDFLFFFSHSGGQFYARWTMQSPVLSVCRWSWNDDDHPKISLGTLWGGRMKKLTFPLEFHVCFLSVETILSRFCFSLFLSLRTTFSGC